MPYSDKRVCPNIREDASLAAGPCSSFNARARIESLNHLDARSILSHNTYIPSLQPLVSASASRSPAKRRRRRRLGTSPPPRPRRGRLPRAPTPLPASASWKRVTPIGKAAAVVVGVDLKQTFPTMKTEVSTILIYEFCRVSVSVRLVFNPIIYSRTGFPLSLSLSCSPTLTFN